MLQETQDGTTSGQTVIEATGTKQVFSSKINGHEFDQVLKIQ